MYIVYALYEKILYGNRKEKIVFLSSAQIALGRKHTAVILDVEFPEFLKLIILHYICIYIIFIIIVLFILFTF